VTHFSWFESVLLCEGVKDISLVICILSFEIIELGIPLVLAIIRMAFHTLCLFSFLRGNECILIIRNL